MTGLITEQCHIFKQKTVNCHVCKICHERMLQLNVLYVTMMFSA